MVEPRRFDRLIDPEVFQRLFENLAPAREVAAHNRMLGMDLVEGPAQVFDSRAKKGRGVLIFHFFDAAAIGVTKKKADHAIGKNAVDETIDDRAQFGFAAQPREKSLGSGVSRLFGLGIFRH